MLNTWEQPQKMMSMKTGMKFVEDIRRFLMNMKFISRVRQDFYNVFTSAKH
jgi:hypothetical protein